MEYHTDLTGFGDKKSFVELQYGFLLDCVSKALDNTIDDPKKPNFQVLRYSFLCEKMINTLQKQKSMDVFKECNLDSVTKLEQTLQDSLLKLQEATKNMDWDSSPHMAKMYSMKMETHKKFSSDLGPTDINVEKQNLQNSAGFVEKKSSVESGYRFFLDCANKALDETINNPKKANLKVLRYSFFGNEMINTLQKQKSMDVFKECNLDSVTKLEQTLHDTVSKLEEATENMDWDSSPHMAKMYSITMEILKKFSK